MGGFGTDIVLRGTGADQLFGGQNSDLINGGPGDDTLVGDLPGVGSGVGGRKPVSGGPRGSRDTEFMTVRPAGRYDQRIGD